MRTILLLFFVLISGICTLSQEYQWGIGLRFGDPLGITVKKYLSDKSALELNFGNTPFRWFEKDLFDKCGWEPQWDDHKCLSSTHSAPIALQVNYLFHNDIKELDGLTWYFGFGGQFRFVSFSYQYQYKPFDNSNWIPDKKRTTEFDIGGNGVIGLEYLFKDYPVSVFLDFILFMEIVDNPFFFIPQGGIGVRYNF